MDAFTGLTPACRALIDRLIHGPVAWESIGHVERRCALALERKGWLESWVIGTTQRRLLTLTPWAMERLGVHLVEQVDEDIIEERGISLGEMDPLCCRCAPLGDEGPPPVQPDEARHILRLDWIEELLAAERDPDDDQAQEVETAIALTAQEALDRLDAGGFWSPRPVAGGGVGPRLAPARDCADAPEKGKRGYRHPRPRRMG
jgi:hypothetical protein